VSAPADWSDPLWLPELSVAIDLCPTCGADEDVHCLSWECTEHVTVRCHRGHGEHTGAVMLPVLLGVRGFGCRN
jgi:hypothetical protein